MTKKRAVKVTLVEERVFSKIYLVRGQKVMLDADLAILYGVEPKALKQAVRRNIERFPEDFMFELKREEEAALRSQFVTLNKKPSLRTVKTATARGRGQHSKYMPFAFTEQGVAMLSGVLKSKRAIEVNIHIMRIFVKMRQLIAGYKELLEKVEKMEADQSHSREHIKNIYAIIKELLEPAAKQQKSKKIGYKTSFN